MDAGILRAPARTTAWLDIIAQDPTSDLAAADGPPLGDGLHVDVLETQAAAGAAELHGAAEAEATTYGQAAARSADGPAVFKTSIKVSAQAAAVSVFDPAQAPIGGGLVVIEAEPEDGDAVDPVLAFIWNDRFFTPIAPAGGIDVNDEAAVDRRVTRSVIGYLMEEEPEVDDFGITGLRRRPVDPIADADLLHVNPGAMWSYDVDGVDGAGNPRSIPVVVNSDGSTFVDPRMRF